jgi:O-antigen/teichoic acid export membrane protein
MLKTQNSTVTPEAKTTHLASDLLKVFSSQLIGILLGITNGFIVPKWLGVAGYGDYKTFLLYASYVGILHFGFADGIYLKYGGKRSEEINLGDLYNEFLFLFFFQLIIFIILLGLALVTGIHFLLPVALIIVPTNLITFFVFIYQATGRFSEYARYNTLRPIFSLCAVLGMIFVFHSRNTWFLIWAQVIIPWVLMAGLLRYSGLPFKTFFQRQPLLSKSYWSHIQVGFFIMLGNLSGILFYSMDRWFVKIFLSKNQFAYYSFAASMMGLILILISAISMTLYPILTRNLNKKDIVAPMRDKLLVFGGIGSGAYFAFAAITQWFLPEYKESLTVISFLFAGVPAITIVNAIYVNLYKAAKLERKYFYQVAIMAAISFGLNVLAVLFHRSNEVIALATTGAFYIWFFCYPRFQIEAQPTKRVILFLIFFGTNFFCTSRFLAPITGGVLFLIVQIIITGVIFPNVIQKLCKKLLHMYQIQ